MLADIRTAHARACTRAGTRAGGPRAADRDRDIVSYGGDVVVARAGLAGAEVGEMAEARAQDVLHRPVGGEGEGAVQRLCEELEQK